MIRRVSTTILDRLRERFVRLYGRDSTDSCMERLALLVGRYGVGIYSDEPPVRELNQQDIMLITYPDIIRHENEPYLVTLHRFLKDHLRFTVNMVHILPFFPYSSDDGFSVINYRQVAPEHGSWEHIRLLGEDYGLMFDLILNHASRQSQWFKDYRMGISPARDYFIEAVPEQDLSAVVRPRSSPLLTRVITRYGERHVWTTFSEDQVDVNFANPDVLFEFLDILLFYIANGARIVRLDAIAYLWKHIGTSCIHLEETHEVVKLFRDVVDMVAPGVRIMTETNVPHEENIGYFGQADEAHMVYQFSLPPLLLHALTTGSSTYLTRWAANLTPPPENCSFFNFTASHDGIGVRPLQGLIPDRELDRLTKHVRDLGGRVSTKRDADGSESPYELNISYFDAMGDPDQRSERDQIDRFLCSQTVQMALQGVPGIYFHSLTATPNDVEGMERTGQARTINRHKWKERILLEQLEDPSSVTARVFNEYSRRLQIRARCKAFHPYGSQRVLDLGPAVFGIVRTSPDNAQRIVCISNFTAHRAEINLTGVPETGAATQATDLLDQHQQPVDLVQAFILEPYQTKWMKV